MTLSELTTVLSCLAVVAGGFNSYFAVRIQRDTAKLKNEILEGINGKYLSRKEADILGREHDKFEAGTAAQFSCVERGLNGLREEFVECRATHNAEAKDR